MPELTHVVDWTQYPLIAINLAVCYMAAKWWRDDRKATDERFDKLAEAFRTSVDNNTAAMRDIEKVLGK